MSEKTPVTPERSNLFSLVVIFSGIILLATVGILVYALMYGQSNSKIDSFEDCEAAGYPILESYPRQCKTPDGKSFTEDIEVPVDEGNSGSEDDGVTDGDSESDGDSGSDGDQSIDDQGESDDYYGRSTHYTCTTDTDCKQSGCGMEICQGKAEEDMVSICIDTGEPNPTEAGYTCGCISNGCAWNK